MSQITRLQGAEICRKFLGEIRSQPPTVYRRGNSLDAGSATGQGFSQKVGQQQHLDPPRTQQGREGVVLVLSARHPGQPVEEKSVVVTRGQPSQFGTGTMQDHGAQRRNFGVDAETGACHD
jgi:hypothetical protein